MSWIKLTRRSFVDDSAEERVTINTNLIMYYVEWQGEGAGSVVITSANGQILVAETVAEIDEKIGVNLASRPSSNLFDPCL